MYHRVLSHVSRLLRVMVPAVALIMVSGPQASAQTIASRLVADRCMDIPGNSTTQGTQVALWSCHGGANQRFTMQSNGQIKTASGLCLNALGGGGRDGDKIGIWGCQGQNAANETWRITANGQIQGINGKCIDIPGGNSAAGTGLVLWGCHDGMNQRWNVASAPPPSAPATVKKLYVIDGTNSRDIHHNSMFHMYEQWTGPKYWADGVNGLATDIDGKYAQVYNTLCQDVRGGVAEVYIAGYSRGAFMALKLANEARANCGANVKFLGLVDAVNSTIYNWPTRVNSGIPVVVHLRKMSGYEHVLTTRDLEGVERILNPSNVDHQTMTCNRNGNDVAWRWTRDKLIEYARRAGGVFGPSQRNGTDC